MSNSELGSGVQDGSDDADEGARFEGLVEQVRQDAAFGSVDDPRTEIATRLRDAGVEPSDQLVESLVARVTEER